MNVRVLAVVVVVVVTITTLAGSAFADGNAPLAEALFREASDLFKNEKYAEACPKFAESNRLDPQRGTLANLARCHEAQGKKALAWADYTQLLEAAKLANDKPRIDYAEKKIAELEPGLARVQLDVAGDVHVKELSVDGSKMGAAVIGTTFPVDAGGHDVSATSEDGRTWTQHFDATENQTAKVTLVAPPPVKKEDPTPLPTPGTGSSPRAWQKPLAIAAIGAGVIGVAIGTTLAVVVFSKKGDVDKNCAGNQCNPIGFEAQKDAWNLSTGATIGFIAGGVLAAAGVVLWITAPKATTQAGLQVGPGGAILKW